jgi:RND superfamily putative drug exporter
MKAILKAKWWILLVWIAAVAALFVTAPDMSELVREKGQIKIADGYSSSRAAQIIEEINEQSGAGDTTTIALVFHNPDGLTDADFAEAEQAIAQLKQQQASLGITDIITHFDREALRDQLVSKDGTTILASLSVEWNDRTAIELSDDLYAALDNIELDHYYTGSDLITEDVVQTTEAGVKKTEALTIVFILVVLIIVFRSVVAPLIPLLTVGLSYAASSAIVAYLVDLADFPLSNFTQIFLVAVLFGIGTDYSILLLNRFKEELAAQADLTGAIAETYRTAGKTVFYSGIAVLVGFAVLGLSQFNIYQSAVAVAVGIAVLLLALFTVFPFFLAVLGKKVFWPAKGSLQHKPSRLWHAAGRFSFARPHIALLIVLVVTVPFVVTYDKQASYNALSEIGEGYRTVQGYDIIEASFGPGEALTTRIVLKNDEEMDQTDYLAIIEDISRALERIDGVDKVRSLTRPTGEVLEDLQVAKQAETLKDGINAGNEGIKEIRDGLTEAGTRLAASSPELDQAKDGIASLIDGTSALKSGLAELQNGLRQIEAGMREGSVGAGEAQEGLAEIRKNAETLLDGYRQLAAGYAEIRQNLETLQGKYAEIEAGLSLLNSRLGELEQAFAYLDGYLNSLAVGPEQQAAVASLQGIESYFQSLKENLPTLSGGMTQLNAGLGAVIAGMDTAADHFAALNDGQSRLHAGMQQLIDGIGELQQGLAAAAEAQGTVIGKLPQVTDGLGRIQDGQAQLLTGFTDLAEKLDQLTDGLDQSVDGLTQIHDGLSQAEDYLAELSADEAQSQVYIPAELLENEDYAQVLDTYLSPDRKITTIDVVLSRNPYSEQSLDVVDELESAVVRTVQGTKLENAELAIGGVSSTFNDLRTISDQDFMRTLIFMLIGICLVLMIQFKSLVMPIYLSASLILTYFTAMGITEFIFVDGLGYEGINWAVPFFAFVMLMALGTDYSIFLMGRFNEYRGEPIRESMIKSMSNMGTVIISAVVILGGTFAAMMPSGVQSLLQISTIVIIGLVLYSFVFLPLFVPVMVKTFGKANWWPFLYKGEDE